MAPTETRKALHRIHVVDSHTEGEPTRVVVSGGPKLGHGPLPLQREAMARHFDGFRALVVDEPRGSPIAVGALLRPPSLPAVAGVIFFNNVGYLGMCGHGTIGVLVTLRHLNRITERREYLLDTPVGVVRAFLHNRREATFTNVASYRYRERVSVKVAGHGRVTGDIAWGGNWFFLVDDPPLAINQENIAPLTEFTHAIRRALVKQRITGAARAEIDHVELSGAPGRRSSDSRNFVLCPGGAYDRSPCGTGTSAKMACLYAEGSLEEGQVWRQEGILGTVFEGRFTVQGGAIVPTIRGSAFVTGEGDLLVDPRDHLVPGSR